MYIEGHNTGHEIQPSKQSKLNCQPLSTPSRKNRRKKHKINMIFNKQTDSTLI